MIPPLSPGEYIRVCRMTTQLTVEDLAARLSTVPYVPEADRADWLRLIEADEQPATFSTIAAIALRLDLDLDLLAALDRIHRGTSAEAPVHCRLCGATPRMIIPSFIPWRDPHTCPVCVARVAREVARLPSAAS